MRVPALIAKVNYEQVATRGPGERMALLSNRSSLTHGAAQEMQSAVIDITLCRERSEGKQYMRQSCTGSLVSALPPFKGGPSSQNWRGYDHAGYKSSHASSGSITAS